MTERSSLGAANLVVAVAITGLLAVFAVPDTEPMSTQIVFVEPAVGAAPTSADLEPPPMGPPLVEARLLLAGDIMQHASQALDDFDATYAKVAPLLQQGDVVVANLEFPVVASTPAGPEPGSVAFNGTPAHLDALTKAGFTLLSTSNNHAFDQGMEGVAATLDEIRSRRMTPVGTAETRAELDERPVIINVRGLRIAFFAYTFTLNTYADEQGSFPDPPADFPAYILNFAEWTDEYRQRGVALLCEHVSRARAAGADLVVALPHWGDEWNFNATEDQKAVARDMVDAGFDLVAGSHAHVVAAPDIVRGHLVAYGLGNFVSDFSDVRTRTGAVLAVTAKKDAAGHTAITHFAFVPLLTRRKGHVVEPLDGRSADEDARAAWELSSKVFGKALVERPRPGAIP